MTANYAIIRCKSHTSDILHQPINAEETQSLAFNVGIDVTFIPKPASAQGNHPNATQVNNEKDLYCALTGLDLDPIQMEVYPV